ncbi:MAG: NAD(P)-dependent glycerol-3-phosphate dehydrogenase [Clostridia bacterium]|nr:NAD(P)-dependent glycerol-3-phosphate dehydrogenase [Clostridia bacterium]
MSNISVLGAGTWGIALATALATNGHNVTVWSAIAEEIHLLSQIRTHKNLPGMRVPPQVNFTLDIGSACVGSDLVVFAVPSVFVAETARKAAEYIHDGTVIADVAKGLEERTHMTLTEVIDREVGAGRTRLVALSGPTHAEEVALRLPTTIVAASRDEEAAKFVQNVFSNDFIRVYTNDDIKGIELSGALKNIIALAAGISNGLGYGDNAKAAIVTRGIAEITRLGVRMGCKFETFSGLAGIGDLVVTCTSQHSRNNRAGYLIGKGYSAKEAVAQVGMVVEGLNALPAAIDLSRSVGVELPICEAVYNVVTGKISVSEILPHLMERKLKSE